MGSWVMCLFNHLVAGPSFFRRDVEGAEGQSEQIETFYKQHIDTHTFNRVHTFGKLIHKSDRERLRNNNEAIKNNKT